MSNCKLCKGKGYTEVHQPGHVHYETDAGEGCPAYHYKREPCSCVTPCLTCGALARELATERAAHAEELRRVEQERQWQPIETAPKRGDFIDLWLRSPDNSEQWREAGCWWNAGRKLWANHNGMWDCATHWMPIPAPPSEQAKGCAR